MSPRRKAMRRKGTPDTYFEALGERQILRA